MRSAPTVCAIQHVPCETLGLIASVLKRQGLAVKLVRPFRGERIPRSLRGCAGLVVMGGPMGVYEQDQHPFLADEIRLLQRAVREAKPVLGVCLGSQLLAAALDAPVTPGRRKEIGWHAVTLTSAASKDPLWRGLERRFVGYHWHGDVFELPRGAVSLARSDLTRNQAFRFGESAYGILFHLEVGAKMIARMTKTFRAELEQAGVAGADILGAATQHLPPLQEIGATVFSRWAELAAEGRAEAPPAAGNWS